MKYFTYFLTSDKNKNWSYVGSTCDLKQRIKEHNAGKTKSTKGYRPLKIAYWEEFDSKEDAYNKELFYKSGFGREKKN